MDTRFQLYQFNCKLASEKQKFLERQQEDLLVFVANQEARRQAFLKQITTVNKPNNPSSNRTECEYVPLPPIPLERQKEEEYRAKAPKPLPEPRVSNVLKSLENNASFMKNRISIQKAKKRLDTKTKVWNNK